MFAPRLIIFDLADAVAKKMQNGLCSLISAASLLKGWENRGSFGEDVSCRVLRALEISGHSRGLDIVSFH